MQKYTFINGQDLDDDEIAALFHSLRTNSSVSDINLGHSTGIGTNGQQALLEMLPYRGVLGRSLHMSLYESDLDTCAVVGEHAPARQMIAGLDLDIELSFLGNRVGPGKRWAEF